jgi:hypothetical protein
MSAPCLRAGKYLCAATQMFVRRQLRCGRHDCMPQFVAESNIEGKPLGSSFSWQSVGTKEKLHFEKQTEGQIMMCLRDRKSLCPCCAR